MKELDYRKILLKALEEGLQKEKILFEVPLNTIYENLKNGFNEYCCGNKEKAKEYFMDIGILFFEKKILFSLFFDMILEIGKIYLENIQTFHKEAIRFIYETVNFSENYFSYGYLIKAIEDNKKRIREKLKLFKGNKEFSSIKPLIRSHLIWVNKLLEDIKKKRITPSIEVNHTKCTFGKELESGKLDLLIKESHIERIKRQHMYVHKIAKDLYLLIEKEDYKNLLIGYIELINAVDRLITLISLSAAVSHENLINIDPLTGVLNRRSMEIILPSQYQTVQISNKNLTIAMLDIDDFKKINDTYGHIVGDCVLKQVAYVIKNTLRKSDFVFRYGGEEFLILLPFTDKKDAVKVLEKLKHNIEKTPIEFKNNKINVTVSIGVASLKEDKGSIERLIFLADKRLYKAKKLGKNQIVF